MSSWKRDFASGLIVLLPLLTTAYVVWWLFGQLSRVPLPVEHPLTRVALLIVLFGLIVFSLGYLMRTTFGDFVESAIDDIMNRLPGLRVVYNASKMAVETAVGNAGELQKPVRITTWPGMRMTAFKTGKRTEDGRDVLFLPTAPNITTGFVIEVTPDQYVETDERVEDALTRILSAGFGENPAEMTQMEIVEDGEEDPGSPSDA